ncbi:hypothetical protein [Paenibacillus lemnae]|uniref:Uncharacterized protein n=1 Tax=Paenibacillus lemnae TaxID=1330551 RepID=A0A848M429_PAELE|nr:hypothetical protein [Paenibacillus lemnae]NMO95697.1 hypothetical protein [Paenibacillus lemnae]
MDVSVLIKEQPWLTVRLQLAAIGKLHMSGRFHEVAPLELSTEKLSFLCDWEIPEAHSVKLNYELDDTCDRLLMQGKMLSRKPWGSRMLYTVRLEASEEQKLRITGILNRMMSCYATDRRLKCYQ